MTDSGDIDTEINIDEYSQTTSYVPPAQRTVNEILETDNNDESLKRYKERLLQGNTGGNIVVVDPSNSLNVIIKKLSVVVNDEIKHSIDLPASSEFTVTIKEGSQYVIQFEFFVQREIITGLKYLHKVSRLGVGVAKESYMLGSYGPRAEAYCYNSPVEEATSGILSRGKYRVRSLITDDDKNRWLEWTWIIDISKEW